MTEKGVDCVICPLQLLVTEQEMGCLMTIPADGESHLPTPRLRDKMVIRGIEIGAPTKRARIWKAVVGHLAPPVGLEPT